MYELHEYCFIIKEYVYRKSIRTIQRKSATIQQHNTAGIAKISFPAEELNIPQPHSFITTV